MCSKHPGHDLDQFCEDCVLPICLQCKTKQHNRHRTTDMVEKTHEAKGQLQESYDRLAYKVQYVVKQVELAKREQQAVRDKQAALAANIRDRQAALKAAADKYAEDALRSLDKVTKNIWESLQADLDCLQNSMRQLQRSQQEVKDIRDSGSSLKQVTGAQKWKKGSVQMEAARNLINRKITSMSRPVCQFAARKETVLQHMRDYIGKASKTEMDVPTTNIQVQEKFRCRQDPDTDVCGLCPLTDGSVYVSYEPYMLSCDLASEKFNSEGKAVDILKCDIRGRNTVVRNRNGQLMYIQPQKGLVNTFAKKCDSDMIRFLKLCHSTPEEASVEEVRVVQEQPLKTKQTELFIIKCAAQRAFDVDSSEQMFVVLEDGKAPGYQRQVQLYRYSYPVPIAMYSPPVEPWQPSDVCFYKKGVWEVLLVADELNDTIHVVNIMDRYGCEMFSGTDLRFSRYLAPGCPLLVQPTALNTDMENRLWVACKGGRILIIPNITEEML